MAEEVIRYGAGGKPYRGQVGPHSTDAEPTPEATISTSTDSSDGDLW